MKVDIPMRLVQQSRGMKFCIWHPKKEAQIWGGHIHLGNKSAIVGYCSESCSCSGRKGIPQMCEGCYGNFRS